MDTLSIAAYYQYPRPRKWVVGPRIVPNKIVIHEPGAPLDKITGIPRATVAKNVAGFNAKPAEERTPRGKGGYHWLADKTTIVIAAPDDKYVNANGHNKDTLDACVCDYELSTLEALAAQCRDWHFWHGIPLIRRAKAQWGTGEESGIYGHGDVPYPNTHTDPRGFPWETFYDLLDPTTPPSPESSEVLLTTIATGPAGKTGRTPTARPVFFGGENGRVYLENGARIVGDTPFAKGRQWRHPDAAGQKLIDICERPDGKGIVALHDNAGETVTYDGLYP